MKRILFSAMLLSPALTAIPQSTQSYQEFRQQILNDYQEFRKTVLSHYADFLEGTWHEYEALEPLKKGDVPKPKIVPDVKVAKPITKPVTLPEPKLRTIPMPERRPMAQTPAEPAPDPGVPGSLLDKPKVEIPPEAIRELPGSLRVKPDLGVPVLAAMPRIPAPMPEPEPSKIDVEHGKGNVRVDAVSPEGAALAERKGVPVVPAYVPEEFEEDRDDLERVKFYDMDIYVPKIDFRISKSLERTAQLATHWKILDEQDVAEIFEETVMPKIRKLGLNDYLTYEFLCAYMDSKFPDAGLMPKMSAVHYILANLGYGVRIAVVSNTGDPILLVPTEQMLYGKIYMTINGQNYYVMSPKATNLNGAQLATCNLPKVANAAKKFDMRINGLNLPVKERRFEVKHGGLTLSGVLNENLMPLVYRYPQMDTGDFAVSVLDKNMRADLVRQVKEQLGGKEKLKATNELLQFIQSGFDYATDDSFHGFEKPYFLEENFYYPKNDCEDRSILYTYMLWNALGIENQLLCFPGHESASVTIPEASVKGTSYMSDGKRYWISDPTYIGSYTGMCMDQFKTTAPTIDLSYPVR